VCNNQNIGINVRGRAQRVALAQGEGQCLHT
jgi:hypothetical protein